MTVMPQQEEMSPNQHAINDHRGMIGRRGTNDSTRISWDASFKQQREKVEKGSKKERIIISKSSVEV
jgi:hypothetical protein